MYFVLTLLDKAANYFSFICKKFKVSKLLDEIVVHGTQRDTYKFVNKLKEKVIEDNITLPCKFEVRGSKWF